MTPPSHPQPEICACDCRMNVGGKCTAPCEIHRSHRSPAAAPVPDGCSLNESCENCTSQPVFICSEAVKKEVQQAAAEARREVLDAIMPMIDARVIIFHQERFVKPESVVDIIETLRGNQQPQRERVLDVMRGLDACGCPHKECHSGEGHDGLNCRDCVIKFIEESLRGEQP